MSRATGARGSAWGFRRSLMTFVLLSSAPLGIGILVSLPPAQLAAGLKLFTDIRSDLIPGYAHRSEVARLPGSQAMETQNAPSNWTAPAVSQFNDHDVLAYGDRVKVTFYESLGVSVEGPPGSGDHAIATIFPRMDLSAEYSVDEGGNLILPKLGQFKAVSEPVTAVQAALSAAFRRAIGRSADVQVAILDRQPVYVLGVVRNVGAFKHVPGMTLLQALADAGGINAVNTDTSKAIEGIRETQRLHQTAAKLDHLLINQARIVALKENSGSLALPASIKTRLAGTAPAEGLKAAVDGAQTALTVERARYEQQRSLAERQVRIAHVELEAQNARADQISALLAKKSDRLHELEGIASKGSVPQFKLTDVGADVSETIARREDLRVALAQSERRLVEAEIALAKIQLDYAAGIERELSVAQEEIDDCSRSIATMQAVTQLLRDSIPDPTDGSVANSPTFRITRRIGDAVSTIPATETTLLLPGDVVRIELPGRVEPKAINPARDVSH